MEELKGSLDLEDQKESFAKHLASILKVEIPEVAEVYRDELAWRHTDWLDERVCRQSRFYKDSIDNYDPRKLCQAIYIRKYRANSLDYYKGTHDVFIKLTSLKEDPKDEGMFKWISEKFLNVAVDNQVPPLGDKPEKYLEVFNYD
jgi:tRNA uridine 5-carbamoylmethylation protein Kti12